jgi:hypothetical protein
METVTLHLTPDNTWEEFQRRPVPEKKPAEKPDLPGIFQMR